MSFDFIIIIITDAVVVRRVHGKGAFPARCCASTANFNNKGKVAYDAEVMVAATA